MTGKHTGHATVRNNRQFKPGEEGQFPIRADDVTLAELLKEKGYATGAMGKWGLGMLGTPPATRSSTASTSSSATTARRHAHSHYPTYIYRNGEKVDLKDNDGETGKQYTHDLFEEEALDVHRGEQGQAVLPVPAVHRPARGAAGAGDSLAEYKGKLGDDPPYDGKKRYLPHDTPRAAYAAMVTRMDRTVGRILDC